jgi:hypothetical protein
MPIVPKKSAGRLSRRTLLRQAFGQDVDEAEEFAKLASATEEGYADGTKIMGLVENRYVKIRLKVTLMKVCAILQEVGELYDVVVETEQAYWAPCWFFMAVWPPAARGDEELAYERGHRVAFNEKYRKAMTTKYAMLRTLEKDNTATGMWE